MSNILLWGTSTAPVARQRITSDGSLRITTTADVRVCTPQAADLLFVRVTDTGDQRFTDDGFRRITDDGPLGPQYFQSSGVTTDGGEEFEFSETTNPWQPPQPAGVAGGENVFAWAHCTFSWSMEATMLVTPFCDGQRDPQTLPNGDTLENVASLFSLPQQSGPLTRVSQVFSVPLVRRLVRNGMEVARFYLRGERLQLAVESSGALGVGECMLEGIQVDYTPVRKAAYPGGVMTVG